MIEKFYKDNKPLSILLLTFVSVLLTYYLFLNLDLVKTVPNDNNVIKYDADWFFSIRKYGYTYIEGQMSNIAFFPFFPYFWKWSHLSGWLICFANLLIFALSFLALMGAREYKAKYLMVISSIPCFIFFFLPYSESWFFLFGTSLIIGFRRKSRILQIIGIFGCCLTRSVSTFFLPAIVITELLSYKRSMMTRKEMAINILLNTLASLSSILMVVVIQGIQTGKWFYYIEVQRYWKRHWMFPSFPFTTISPNKILGIDAIAMILGVIAMYFSLKWGQQWLKQILFKDIGSDSNQEICKSVYFSALFLSAIVIVDTCFTYNIEGRSNIQCMNRHLMCTSFALCFLNWMHKDYIAKWKDGYIIIAILIGGIFVSGIYSYYHHVIYYALFCSSFFLYKFFPKLEPVFIILFFFNVFFLVIFYHDFLNDLWVG